MASLELLDNDAHAGLRMGPSDQATGIFVRLVMSEIAVAAASCPLLFSKHMETGAFYIGALMGFRDSEILVDHPDERSAFKPMEADRAGFFAVGENIALDREHIRFSEEKGDLLFDLHGKPTPALMVVRKSLGGLMSGNAATEAFLADLVAHQLIEPIDITLSFDDGERLRLEGLYTVSLDTISELDDETALKLFRAGHLQAAYVMAASLNHIALMARRRNARLASA